MFREMRRKDKELTKEEMFEILKKEEYGVISTIGEDNYPYGVPVNYVYHNNCIYFHCAVEGHKLDNMKFNSNVSFTIVCDTELIPKQFSTKFKSVIIFGKAVEVFDEEKEEGLVAVLEKFSSAFMESGMKYIKNASIDTKVFKIEIKHMSVKGYQ